MGPKGTTPGAGTAARVAAAGPLTTGVVALTALAGVHLGVHWPPDVLGGAAVGATPSGAPAVLVVAWRWAAR